jgi:hypothetical protein
MKLNQAKNIPTSPGKKFLIRHLEGHRLPALEAIEAKCCECMNGYSDGKTSCRIPDCPLFPWMPFAKKPEPELAVAN